MLYKYLLFNPIVTLNLKNSISEFLPRLVKFFGDFIFKRSTFGV